MFGGDKDVRPESLKSIKNFVAAKNHHKEMSMSRFQHIEDLLLCAEMAWAVREAHHEVVYHVLHGEIVETDDEHILQARGHVAQEMRQVVRESERCLEGMHEEHWSMMRLVHTVIASRSTLHYILNKIEMLVHKGACRAAPRRAVLFSAALSCTRLCARTNRRRVGGLRGIPTAPFFCCRTAYR